MKKFFLYSLATVGGLFLLLMLMFVLSVRSLFTSKSVAVHENSQLYIHLTHKIEDFPREHSFVLSASDIPSVWEIEEALRCAANDSKINTVLLHLDFPDLSWSQVYALNQAFYEFKKSGKRLECFASSFGILDGGLKSYALATACTSIVLQPLGEVAVSPISEQEVFGGERLFFKKLFDRFNVKADFIAKGKYKSAPEPFLLSSFSVETKEMLNSIINEYEQAILSVLNQEGGARKFDKQFLVKGPYTDIDALKLNLVSKVSHDVGEAEHKVTVADYMHSVKASSGFIKKPVVAVVPLDGTILDDGAAHGVQEAVITPKHINEIVESLKSRTDVAAVVLSINSPGGSALASDKISYLIKQLQKHKKVVVHMRDAAASGGYYIAASAQHIVANPFALTGSIGVFMGKFVIGDALKDFGVSFEALNPEIEPVASTSLHAFSNSQRQYILRSINRTYDRFVETVAEGRNLSKAAVLGVAEGRVWTGTQAQKKGLVDTVGGLNSAILKAMELSEKSEAEYTVEIYRHKQEWVNILFELLHTMQNMQKIFGIFMGKIQQFSGINHQGAFVEL